MRENSHLRDVEMNRLTCVVVLGVFAAGPAAAQDDYQAGRTAFGHPDIQGVWTNATLTPQARSSLYGLRASHTAQEVDILEGAELQKTLEGNAPIAVDAGAGGASDNVGAYDQGWVDNGVTVMRVNGEPRTSLITTPDGQAPVRRGARARTIAANAGSTEAGIQAARQAAERDKFEGQGNVALGSLSSAFDNPENRSAGERCLISFGRNAGPPMFPNGWYNNNYRIVQGRDSVAIEIEMVHDMRIVRLNSEHRTDGVRPWFGDSIGWYEGDTLVVETTNIPERQDYYGSWENLTVTERYTRVADDRLHYAFTIEDPTMWDAPWGGEYEFGAIDGEVYEYACHEGNYALEGILAGAREAEAEAAESAAAR
jgi:hypothetical protein